MTVFTHPNERFEVKEVDPKKSHTNPRRKTRNSCVKIDPNTILGIKKAILAIFGFVFNSVSSTATYVAKNGFK